MGVILTTYKSWDGPQLSPRNSQGFWTTWQLLHGQVTVARHMEMSAEDIGATLAYGCQRLVEEDRPFFGQQKIVASDDLFLGTKNKNLAGFLLVSFCEVVWAGGLDS